MPWVAVSISGFSVLAVTLELLLYREFIDPCFPTRHGTNIIGVIPAQHHTTRRILLTAHQDSAWEFNLWFWFKSAGVVINALGLLGMLVPGALGILVGLNAVNAPAATVFWTAIFLAPVLILHLLFHTGRAVPGAMDNLAGIAIISEAGRHLAAQNLSNTEIWLVACAAEECGLRGSKRFVSKYGWVLHQIPTWDINVDGVYDETYLSAVTRGITTGTLHDDGLVSLAQRVASTNKHIMRKAVIPFGGTDAASFTAIGVKSVSLLCQDTRKLAPNYHTRLDTPDRIQPSSLSVMHDVVTGMANAIDRGDLDDSNCPE